MKPSKLSAFDKALALLARREHSTRELFWKLSQKGFETSEIEEALTRLKGLKYLDDNRFVGCFIRARVAQGHGPLKILAELQNHDILAKQVEAHEVWREQSWKALAFQVKVKRFGESTPADLKQKSKQMQFLHRRGFSTDQIQFAFSSEALSLLETPR